MEKIIGYPFVAHVNQNERPTIENPKDFLNRAYIKGFTNNDNLLSYGVYKLMGYRYDFKPLLKKYVYKQYDDWTEVYAPNKTKLRQVVGGKIDMILEIPQKNKKQ